MQRHLSGLINSANEASTMAAITAASGAKRPSSRRKVHTSEVDERLPRHFRKVGRSSISRVTTKLKAITPIIKVRLHRTPCCLRFSPFKRKRKPGKSGKQAM